MAEEGLLTIGSSPPAWGTQNEDCERGWQDRFIPTRMGNT